MSNLSLGREYLLRIYCPRKYYKSRLSVSTNLLVCALPSSHNWATPLPQLRLVSQQLVKRSMVDRAIRSTVNWHNEYYHAGDRHLVAVEMPKFESIECSVESLWVVRRGDVVRAEE